MTGRPELNRKFPGCAIAARRLLAEVYGCQPGDLIPAEDELLARARLVQAAEPATAMGWLGALVNSKATVALAMVEEIGGIFEKEPDDV